MTVGDESDLARGMDAFRAYRFADAYALLLPFAEAGNSQASESVGLLLFSGAYRFSNMEQFHQSERGGQALDSAAILSDYKRAAQFLSAASDAGLGSASFHLASVYLAGFDDTRWPDRLVRARELCELAISRGFTDFPWRTGQAYLGEIRQIVDEIQESERDSC